MENLGGNLILRDGKVTGLINVRFFIDFLPVENGGYLKNMRASLTLIRTHLFNVLM